MVTATETYRIYLLKNPMSRRSVISTLKSLNPPEGAAHQYKFLEEIPWYSNGDDIPDTYFEVHSLGSQNYADVVVPITTTSNNGNQIDIHLNCNVDVWMTNVTPATIGILHGTTGVNAMVLKNPENHPVFTQSETASVSEINTTAGKSWFNSSMESMTIYWEGYKDLSRVEMVDINGRLVKTSNQSNVKGNVLFEGLAPGTYLVNFINSDNVRFATLNVAK